MDRGSRPTFDLVTKTVRFWEEVMSGAVKPTNQWVSAREGKAYTRYSAAMDRIDIANITVKKSLRGKGLLKAMIAAAMNSGVRQVRLESIQNVRLEESAKRWRFPGWVTTWEGVICPSAVWVRK